MHTATVTTALTLAPALGKCQAVAVFRSFHRSAANAQMLKMLAADGVEHLGSDDSTVSESKPQQCPFKIKSFKEMPGPRGLPLIGTLLDYVGVKKQGFSFSKLFLAQQSRIAEYGPIYKENIGHQDFVVTSSLAEYSKLMRSEGKYPRRIQLEPMVHFRKSRGMSLGLVNSQGEEWHRFRSLLSKKMLRPKEIEQYNPQINTVSKDLVERLGVVKADNSHIQGVELEIFKWALESVGTILFEERIGCFDEVPSTEAREFIGHVLGYFRTMQSLLFGPPLYKIRPTKEWLTHCEHGDKVFELGKAFVQKRVDALSRSSEAQTTSKQSSLLTHMLAASELSRDEVVHTLVDLMQGAIETTSNTVLWTLYQLATHPTAQEKLYNEVMNVVGEHGDVTTDALAKMPYVKACLKETFRKFPVTFATSRIIPRDIEMGGYTIPKGSHVQASLYSMGRDPKLFNDPETYNPDRWLGMHNDEVSKLPSLAFGHGARMCIGRRIAEQEIYTGISQIVRKYKLEYDGPEVKPTLQLVMTPDKPIVMKFVPRR